MDSEGDLYDDVGMNELEDSGHHDTYIILKEERIKQLQEKYISEVCNVLSVSRGIACTLLLRENWSLISVVKKWLADDNGVLEVIAVSEKPNLIELDNYCKLCLERVENDNILSLPCGHPFCADCWRTYFAACINKGPECLNLRCPEPKCKAAAGLDMMESVLSSDDDDRNKYYRYLYRSYIECSKNRKWCPAPGCEYAVEFATGGCKSYDVTCDCSYKFCWNCMEECHHPVTCQMVLNWNDKSKSTDIKWWCLENWGSSGDWCDDGTELTKFAHYYKRWAKNNESMEIALDRKSRARKQIPILSEVQGETEKVLQCVSEAWEQIVECRRVLKWSYVCGYYMDTDKVKKMFFEYLQGEAEAIARHLCRCAEKQMGKYVKADGPCKDFRNYRLRLTSLTGVTRKYFQNLVKALENKLCEVDDQVAGSIEF